MERLVNVSQLPPIDEALSAVRGKVDDEESVSGALGATGLQAIIEAASANPAAPLCLDLIAHSKDGVLVLGDWLVDGTGELIQLVQDCKAALARTKLSRVRLLGCYTAVTDGGREAMKTLRAELRGSCPNIQIWGTTAPISATDFNGKGFLSSGLLQECGDLTSQSPGPLESAGVTRRWFAALLHVATPTTRAALRLESTSLAVLDRASTRLRYQWPIHLLEEAAFDACFAALGPKAARVPGLLALPQREVVAMSSDGRVQRMTLLLSHYIRLYPLGVKGGVLVEADPSIVSQMQQGVPFEP